MRCNHQKVKEKIQKTLLILVLYSLYLLTACNKEKIDFQKDNRYTTGNIKTSTVRVVNLGRYNQVIVNGDSLTNFIFRDPELEIAWYPPTRYFPKNGRLTEIWEVPQDLLSKNGSAKAKLGFVGLTAQGSVIGNPEFNMQEDNVHPTDYFVLEEALIEGQPPYVAIPRDITQPAKPDHFKIRIINLMAEPIHNFEGREDLTGPITLAYADGTPVSGRTSNISLGQRASEYVELPYGTYQFKVLNAADNRQIPGGDPAGSLEGVMDMATSSIGLGYQRPSNLHYAPIRTYQPGGVYTIVVSPRSFSRHANPTEVRGDVLQNAFKVIEDITEPLNRTYCRIQAVNAVSGQNDVTFKINGQPWKANVSYAGQTDYSIRISGNVNLEAVDRTGKVLSSTTQLLRPSQNYSAWLHPNADGQPTLSLITNDLSGNSFIANTAIDDGSNSRAQSDFFIWYRFLNFSIGNPYTSFTAADGEPLVGDHSPAAYNLQPGKLVAGNPYVARSYRAASRIQIYRSTPSMIPGIWAEDIPIKTGTDFISRNALYDDAGRPVPYTEAGVYTVALIGRSGANVPETEKAKIIIVKHNK